MPVRTCALCARSCPRLPQRMQAENALAVADSPETRALAEQRLAEALQAQAAAEEEVTAQEVRRRR